MKVLNKNKSLSVIEKLLLSLALIIAPSFAGDAHAETVSQKEAMNIASTFFNAVNENVMASPKMVYNGRKLTTGRLFSPFYVYNHPTGGFVIVSAENKAFPILAYSRSDSFDPNKIDAGLEALLTLYARHIENIRYDSSPTEEAVRAWGDINAYIASILYSPAEVTDVLISKDDADSMLAPSLRGEDSGAFSAIYTPEQWETIVGSSLKKDRNAVVGIVSPGDVFPIVLQGEKGGMYRITFPGILSGFYRILPTEVLSAGEVVPISDVIPETIEEEEDTAFRFYDDFIATMLREEAEARKSIEEALFPTSPVVIPAGSGNFTVKLPGAPSMTRIYNVAGNLIGVQRYKGDYPEAHIALMNETSGFYFAVIFLEDGRSFGVKLYR